MANDPLHPDNSREIATPAKPIRSDSPSESIPEHKVDPNVKNSHLPKGVDKPDGELESVNDDLKRVEKRTTM